MLGLGVGFYGIGGDTVSSSWSPTNESSLTAWYKFGTPAKNPVDSWLDSSGNGYHMLQTVVNDQPSNSAGVITFDSNDDLQSNSSINLTGALTIGIRLNTSVPENVILADNLASNNMIKQIDSNTFRFRTTTGSGDIDLDGSDTFGDDYLVLTRDGSNGIELWRNGVKQADTATKAGTSIINAIGTRFDHTDNFAGDLYEVQIFNSTSAGLTANVNTRLAGL
jgi:hypothetical protein